MGCIDTTDAEGIAAGGRKAAAGRGGRRRGSHAWETAWEGRTGTAADCGIAADGATVHGRESGGPSPLDGCSWRRRREGRSWESSCRRALVSSPELPLERGESWRSKKAM